VYDPPVSSQWRSNRGWSTQSQRLGLGEADLCLGYLPLQQRDVTVTQEDVDVETNYKWELAEKVSSP